MAKFHQRDASLLKKGKDESPSDESRAHRRYESNDYECCGYQRSDFRLVESGSITAESRC